MCGIVGYVGLEDAVDVLTPALKRLEYRGYDSAGLATLDGPSVEVRKAPGKIVELERVVAAQRPAGHLGIAHTRWATHGRPSAANAHPHLDCHGRIAVVHNGIIENHRQLRDELAAEGHRFRSDTDTEVIAHLVERYQAMGLPGAVREAASRLRGSFAIACIAGDAPDMIVALRGGSSPLVLGVGGEAAYLASDLPALLGRTREALVLAEGEMAVLTRGHIAISRLDGAPVHRAPTRLPDDCAAVERGGYPHFMLKEIHEQPHAVLHTLVERGDARPGDVDLSEIGLTDAELARMTRATFLGCGTSWHAALLGRHLMEDLAGLPAAAEIASECRHRQPLYGPRVLVIPVSQSGETADTLAAVRDARRYQARAVAISNVVGSSIARESDGALYTRAGLEIGVAATKSFACQFVAVALLALKLGRVRGRLSPGEVRASLDALHAAPALMEELLAQSAEIRALAERLAAHRTCLYLGRGLLHPIALEGALKLKEVSYLHAEGYPAGELKHGPIALIEPGVPVVAIAPAGPTATNMASNIQEVKARDGFVVAVATRGDEAMASLGDVVIPLPPAPPLIQPLLAAVPLQLLAYHLAVVRGCDVDQPRNLAKSVTVE